MTRPSAHTMIDKIVGERDEGETALAVAKHLAADFEAFVQKRLAALQVLEKAVQAAQVHALTSSKSVIVMLCCRFALPQRGWSTSLVQHWVKHLCQSARRPLFGPPECTAVICRKLEAPQPQHLSQTCR